MPVLVHEVSQHCPVLNMDDLNVIQDVSKLQDWLNVPLSSDFETILKVKKALNIYSRIKNRNSILPKVNDVLKKSLEDILVRRKI